MSTTPRKSRRPASITNGKQSWPTLWRADVHLSRTSWFHSWQGRTMSRAASFTPIFQTVFLHAAPFTILHSLHEASFTLCSSHLFHASSFTPKLRSSTALLYSISRVRSYHKHYLYYKFYPADIQSSTRPHRYHPKQNPLVTS
jgi:hypothetical protein